MAFRTETKVIDGLEVKTTQLPAMRGLALYSRLGRVDMPVPILATLDRDSSAPLEVGFSHMPHDEVAALVREILASTHCTHGGKITPLGSDDAIIRVFSGNLKQLLAVCWFAVQVQFADFFAAASDTASASDEAPAETAEESPSISTPTSKRRRLRTGSSTPGA